MSDNLYSDFEFEKVQLWFVSRALVTSENDMYYSVMVSPDEAITMLQAHLTPCEADLLSQQAAE